jgi:arylsulfatase A-like enzyme
MIRLHVICIVVTLLLTITTSKIAFAQVEDSKTELPNILWLSTEDIGPHLGCYDDPDAITPNLDRFAKRSLVYDVAWSNYPVCAPARTTIISGMYACSLAAGNMRSEVILPDEIAMFPYYLRQSGYYCTNNHKTDYNFAKPKHEPWDESSKKAHWKNRKPGQPFFAVFNHTGTHESKIRVRPHEAQIDPAGVTLPGYWPDTPEVRQDWAQYHDNITRMDNWFQERLDELEAAGLTDNTIVVFFGDHGSGMPRHKRYAGNSGMHVPFIVHVPERWQKLAPDDYAAGGRTSRPVGFVDLAATMLSIAGIEPPDYMHGHAFMGHFETPVPKYCYGFRDRMDERPDISRAIRDQRFIYIRNYLPHLPAGQDIDYQLMTPTTAVWKKIFNEGKLNAVQSAFWRPRSPEELYDLESDPTETRNLVNDAEFQDVLSRFQKEHADSMKRFGDLGLIPESLAYKFGRERSRWLIQQATDQFPLDEIYDIADRAASVDRDAIPELVAALSAESASVRYWGVLGLHVRGDSAVLKNIQPLAAVANEDKEPIVRIAAAQALLTHAESSDSQRWREILLELADMRQSDYYAAIYALNAINLCFDSAEIDRRRIESLPRKPDLIKRGNSYANDLIDGLLK